MDDPRAPLLIGFLNRYCGAGREDPVTFDTPLISEGLLDSMGLLLLATFIEEEFGVPFDGTELRAGRCETVRDVVALIAAG